MPHLGVRELQRDTSRVLERAASGERLVVTRHNRPVAVILGIAAAHEFIRSLRRTPQETRRLRLEFDRWIWSGEIKPLNVLIAEVAGDRPVREVDLQD